MLRRLAVMLLLALPLAAQSAFVVDEAGRAIATVDRAKRSVATTTPLSPPYPKKKPAPLSPRLTFVDLGAVEARSVIDIPGTDVRRPVAVADLLYVVDGGSTSAGGGPTVVVSTGGPSSVLTPSARVVCAFVDL
jgi:hypothetical protein